MWTFCISCKRSDTSYLPCGAIFSDSLSSKYNVIFIIARAAGTGHTLSHVIHVGPLCTATAVHYREAALAGVVHLAQRTAGPVAARHVVLIHSPNWTDVAEFA